MSRAKRVAKAKRARSHLRAAVKKDAKKAQKGRLRKKLHQRAKLIGMYPRYKLEDVYALNKDIEPIGGDDDDAEMEEDALPTDMIDPELAEDWLKTQPRKKRAKQNEDAHAVDQTRSFAIDDEDEKVHLLPIKTAGGKIVKQFAAKEAQQVEQVDELEEAADMKDVEVSEQKLAPAEQLAERKRLLHVYKLRIAAFCQQLIEDPETHVHKLRHLVDYATSTADSLEPYAPCVQIRRLSAVSLVEVFKQIVPGYAIRQLTEMELQQSMKKDTKRLIDYEAALLRNYKKFIKALSATVRKNKKGGDGKEFQIAVQCISSLLVNHYHFNHVDDLIAQLVPLAIFGSVDTRTPVCSAFKQLFSSDREMQASLLAVKSMSSSINSVARKISRAAHSKRVRVAAALADVCDTFSSLRVKQLSFATDPAKQREAENSQKSLKQRGLEREAKLRQMSQKQRKGRRVLAQVERDLKDFNLEQQATQRSKLQNKLLEQVFTTYFRVLRSPLLHRTRLLDSVLNGFARFSHLINIDFMDDLVTSLDALIADGELSVKQRLNCIQTAVTVLSGEGETLCIDPHSFYRHLYVTLATIGLHNRDSTLFSHALYCADLLLLQRRKSVGLTRAAAFAKRFARIASHTKQDESIRRGALSALGALLVAFPTLDGLVDSEQNAPYDEAVHDPEHCNALRSNVLKEMNTLKNVKDDPLTGRYVNEILRFNADNPAPKLLVERRFMRDYIGDGN